MKSTLVINEHVPFLGPVFGTVNGEQSFAFSYVDNLMQIVMFMRRKTPMGIVGQFSYINNGAISIWMPLAEFVVCIHLCLPFRISNESLC